MHARVQKHHREYETVYLLAPTTTPGGAARVGDSIREVLDETQGKVLKVDLWGIRPLAYRIKKHTQGIYYYMRYIATQGAVDEMERRLKLAEPVLRYLTVRLSTHEVDPAAYTVKKEDAEFKPIDDLHESLQALEVGAGPVEAEPAEAEPAEAEPAEAEPAEAGPAKAEPAEAEPAEAEPAEAEPAEAEPEAAQAPAPEEAEKAPAEPEVTEDTEIEVEVEPEDTPPEAGGES